MPTKAKTVTKNSKTSPKLSLQKVLEAAKQEATGSKTSAYMTTTALVGLLYTLIGVVVLTLTPAHFQSFAWLILSFVFALSFSPLRYAFEELTRQLFPGTDYDSHELVKRLNAISYSSLTLNDLSQLFFQNFETRFDAPEAAFIFFNNKDYLIKTSDHFKNLQSLTNPELDLLSKRAQPMTLPFQHFKDENANRILEHYHIRMVVPLTNNEGLLGLLLLGATYNLKPYTTKDIKVLSAIAPKVAFAIKNAFEYEKVSHKNTKLITELKEANDKLRQANRRLKHDDKLKDEFVYVATHELKNPITAMRGYLSLINEGQFGRIPKKMKGALEQLNASNQQLIGLLNNLLQIARSEAQKLEIHTKPVVICQVIDEVIHDLKPLSDQKNLTIQHTCPNTAVAVMADKERLREITSNLLSNSIKYSTKGVITISHEIIQDQLATSIADQGVGIAQKDQDKIFTRFFRVEEEAAKGIPGTGLGLFIVKQLIEKMGGKIWFTSKLNHGSTFTFSLPLARTYTLKSAD